MPTHIFVPDLDKKEVIEVTKIAIVEEYWMKVKEKIGTVCISSVWPIAEKENVLAAIDKRIAAKKVYDDTMKLFYRIPR